MPPPFIAYEIWELQQTKYLKIFFLVQWKKIMFLIMRSKEVELRTIDVVTVNINKHLKCTCLWCNKMFLTMVEMHIYQTLDKNPVDIL